MENKKEPVSVEEMIEEAIKRMKILKLHKNAIKEFEQERKLNKSDFNMGILFWLDNEEEKNSKRTREKV